MIESIIKGLKKDLKKDKDTEKYKSKVSPNHKAKTISVTYDFGALVYQGLKIIANRETWLMHWIDQVLMKMLKDFKRKKHQRKLRKPLKSLRQYPITFKENFSLCVLYANAEENPDFKIRVKQRKPSQYNLRRL